jgi:hypothetical protein
MPESAFFNEMTDFDPTGKDVLIDLENCSKHLLPLPASAKILISGSKSHDS